MADLDDAVSKIRRRVGDPPELRRADEYLDEVLKLFGHDPAERRRLAQCRYAAFSKDLQDAMKVAAKRWDWDKEDWIMQIEMIADALQAGRVIEDQLAMEYRNVPPGVDDDAPTH